MKKLALLLAEPQSFPAVQGWCDFSKAGVTGDEAWIKRAKDFVTPVPPHVPPTEHATGTSSSP